jgi:hypothetical protein
MTLIKAAQKALEALEAHADIGIRSDKAITALRTAIEQAEKQEPVAHSVVAGALFDFMGWLTSRDKRLTLSSTDEATPAVEAITEFAKMRGLRLEDARVEHWQAILTTPPAQPAPVQVSPTDFVDMVLDKEDAIGKPLFWAEWPNREKNNAA